MKIVGRQILSAFCKKHSDAGWWVENWLADVESADWASPRDIKARYAAASLLTNNVVIFNVKGNRYRLETAVAYRTAVILVQWAGTHAAYDARNRKRKG